MSGLTNGSRTQNTIMLTAWLNKKPENAAAVAAAVRRKHERDEREINEAEVEENIKKATKFLRKEASAPAPPPWLD